MSTEPLTDAMIRNLLTEAHAAGDHDMADLCNAALYPSDESDLAMGRSACADAINGARGMDDSRPFVKVIP